MDQKRRQGIRITGMEDPIFKKSKQKFFWHSKAILIQVRDNF